MFTTTTYVSFASTMMDADGEEELRQKTSVDAVRRCLFGPADRQIIKTDLAAIRRQIDDQARDRWNFDFPSGTPLPTTDGGRYAWTPVDQATSTVMTTSTPSRRRFSTFVRRTPAKATKLRRLSLTSSPSVAEKETPSKMTELRKLTSSPVIVMERRRKLRATRILDYFPRKKSNQLIVMRSKRRI